MPERNIGIDFFVKLSYNITMDKAYALSADIAETAKALRIEDFEFDPELFHRFETAVECMAYTREYSVMALNDSIAAFDNGIRILGDFRGLGKCEGAYVVVMTLGKDIDDIITAQSEINTVAGLVFDAAAQALCEKGYRMVWEDLNRCRPGGLSRPYMPGVKLPMTEQLSVLACIPDVPVTANKHGVMSPSKSISAIYFYGGRTTPDFHNCSVCLLPECELDRRERLIANDIKRD